MIDTTIPPLNRDILSQWDLGYKDGATGENPEPNPDNREEYEAGYSAGEQFYLTKEAERVIGTVVARMESTKDKLKRRQERRDAARVFVCQLMQTVTVIFNGAAQRAQTGIGWETTSGVVTTPIRNYPYISLIKRPPSDQQGQQPEEVARVFWDVDGTSNQVTVTLPGTERPWIIPAVDGEINVVVEDILRTAGEEIV